MQTKRNRKHKGQLPKQLDPTNELELTDEAKVRREKHDRHQKIKTFADEARYLRKKAGPQVTKKSKDIFGFNLTNPLVVIVNRLTK